MGNHEIMMLLAASAGRTPQGRADVAPSAWAAPRAGQMRAGRTDPGAATSLLWHAPGRARRHRCGHAQPCAARQHAVRPWRARSACRSRRVPDQPWTIFTEARWAWINHGFLDWKAGFKGTLVVHGHTPPDKHREISGMEDPHLFEGDRLGSTAAAPHRHRRPAPRFATAVTHPQGRHASQPISRTDNRYFSAVSERASSFVLR
jgi:serine/threonine protein phosphatase 1